MSDRYSDRLQREGGMAASGKFSEIGKCPSCGEQLKRTGHKPGEPKGRYQCMNSRCAERGWFNKSGDRR